MATKWVYLFSEGNANMRNLLGGKGANLAEMTNLGLPVPQGFTITTEACTQYYEDGRKINDDISPRRPGTRSQVKKMAQLLQESEASTNGFTRFKVPDFVHLIS